MRKKIFFYLLIVCSFLSITSYSFLSNPNEKEIKNVKLTVYFIDVGMGDAIFLDIPPKDCMLIDAGSWDKYGIDNLIQFLNQFFDNSDHDVYERTIDVVLASHQHKDHIQGMMDILNNYKVTTYFDNGVGYKFAKKKSNKLIKDINKLLKSKSVRHLQLTDEMIELQGIKGIYTNKFLDPFDSIDVFALSGTPNPVDKKENDNSIVLKVLCDSISFLFTGDAEEKEENKIISRLKKDNNIKALNIDVLKVGHHGSNTASSEEFIKPTSPSISIVEVGVASESPKTKQYRLPKESIFKRLKKYVSNELNEVWDVEVFPDKVPKNIKKEKPKVFKTSKEMYFTSSNGTIMLKTDGRHAFAEIFEPHE